MRKKIIFVDQAEIIGGAELCLAGHLKYLNRKYFTPYLVVGKKSLADEIFLDINVPIFKIHFEALKRLHLKVLLRVLISLWQLRSVVGKVQPDIVVANTTRALIISLLAKKNYKLISYIRDKDYPKWLMRTSRLRVDKYLLVSEHLNHYYGPKETKTEVVYLGSDLEQQLKQIRPSQVKNFRRSFGFNDSDFIIGFVGRVVVGKGPHILVKAMTSISDPTVKLVIFGTGEGQEGNIENKLRKQVKNLGLEKKVRFAGFVSQRGLIYKSLDLFILPTCESEAFATSVIEAALAKLPIIATNLGGTPEFIKDGYNGLLVRPGNTRDLKRALVRLIEDKKLGRKLGKQAYQDAQSFTEEKLAKKLEKIYESCLSS